MCVQCNAFHFKVALYTKNKGKLCKAKPRERRGGRMPSIKKYTSISSHTLVSYVPAIITSCLEGSVMIFTVKTQ